MGRKPVKDPRVGVRIGIPLSILERIRKIALQGNSSIGIVTNTHFDRTLALLLCEHGQMPNMYVFNGELVFDELVAIARRCQNITNKDPRFKKTITIGIADKEVAGDGTSNPTTTSTSSTGTSRPISDTGRTDSTA